jgi:prevent-host-death family protein
MKVSITDFNNNISAYITKAKTEPIELTKRGTVVAVIISKKDYEKRSNQT